MEPIIERSAEQWDRILTLCGVEPHTAVSWSGVFAEQIIPGALSAGEDELDDFLGQVLHESMMLQRTVENLNYSAEGLMRTWPSRFPFKAQADALAHSPIEIANYVYADRLGNTEPGDGWHYRGRGLIMVTGRDGYEHLGVLLGLPLGSEPELLEDPLNALRSALLWWEGHIPDSMLNDLVRVTKRVSGGLTGIEHRREVTDRATAALAAQESEHAQDSSE